MSGLDPTIKLSNSLSAVGNTIVINRFRPLNKKEIEMSEALCVEFVNEKSLKLISESEKQTYNFNFDRVFDVNSTQVEVFAHAARPIIESVLEGFNGTIFAYGQTSSGKTHTMTGVLNHPELEGIIPRVVKHVFNHIENCAEHIEYTVKISMVEIYMERIRDLFNPVKNNLKVREEKNKGIYIDDLTEEYITTEEEVLERMMEGNENRTVSYTNMNAESSRSHSLFIMTIHQNNTQDLSAKSGKLYLVDLAGSEKISKTGASGSTLEEAKTINKSLTTLGMVIMALTENKSGNHVPYRESKLTRVLQESLGGNAKTCLIITCSPSNYNESESLSTLRFGLRAKKIKNKAKINKEVSVGELNKEIDRLENELLKSKKIIDNLESLLRNKGLNIPSNLISEEYLGIEAKNDEAELNNSFESDEDNKKDKGQKEDKVVKKDVEAKDTKLSSKKTIEAIPGIKIGDNKDIDLLNEQLLKEREMFHLQDKKMIELRVQYFDMLSQVGDLEDIMDDLNQQIDSKNEQISKFLSEMEKKNQFIKDLELSKQKTEELMLQQKQLLQEFYKSKKRKSNTGVIDANQAFNSNQSRLSENPINYSNVYAGGSNSPTKSPMKSPRKKHMEERTNSFIAKFNDFTSNCKEINVFNSQGGEFTTNEMDRTDERRNSRVERVDKAKKHSTKRSVSKKNESESKEKTDRSEKKKDGSTNKLYDSDYRRRSLNHSLNDRSLDDDSKEDMSFLNKSGDSQISGSYEEDSLNSVDVLKEKMEEEKKIYNKNLDEKNGRIKALELDLKIIKEKYNLIKRRLRTEDDAFLEKIHKEHTKTEHTIESLNRQIENYEKEKKAMKLENISLEKNIEGISCQIMNLEKENLDLTEQIKLLRDKIAKLNFQMKTKNVVKVIKGGRIKHNNNNINESKIKEDPSHFKSNASVHLAFEANNNTAFCSNMNQLINDI